MTKTAAYLISPTKVYAYECPFTKKAPKKKRGDYSKLLEDIEVTGDVTIMANGEPIKFHLAVIYAECKGTHLFSMGCSDYGEGMKRQRMIEGKEDEALAFDMIREFIYKGFDSPLSIDLDFIKLADSLLLDVDEAISTSAFPNWFRVLQLIPDGWERYPLTVQKILKETEDLTFEEMVWMAGNREKIAKLWYLIYVKKD